MGIVSSAKDLSRVDLEIYALVSIPDGDSFLREAFSPNNIRQENAVSIPDGDSFLREALTHRNYHIAQLVSIPDGDSFLREAIIICL